MNCPWPDDVMASSRGPGFLVHEEKRGHFREDNTPRHVEDCPQELIIVRN